MSQVWYAGLLPLSIVGLVAIRVAQMEQTLEGILKASVSAARAQRRTPVILVPDFCAADLAPGWKTRARAIADALRGDVLKDVDYHSLRAARAGASDKSGAMFDFPAHADTFIEPVIAFFAT
ncbi:hypothetical protein U1872_10110 [Sphingomonas sp. RB3P16]|uniref:hypothetical protein n=1 Tax=Parasphingomonas frigoris TaxID=3096163 RepID=UPI002FC6F843